MMVNRRNLLGAGLVSLAAGALPNVAAAAPKHFFGPGRVPLGLQLYTLDADLQRDFDGTLRAVAQLGVEIVEIASLHGKSGEQLRRSLDAAGLRATGLHVPVAPIVSQVSGLTFADVQQVADCAHALGVKQVVLPIIQFPIGSRWNTTIDFVRLAKEGGGILTADTYERMADFLNELGLKLQKNDLQLGYHNHNIEFAPIDKTTGFEILLAKCDPALVTFEMDAGWVAAAGHDPVTLLRRYPGRFTQMHVKDIKANPVPDYAFRQTPAEVGSGSLNWPQILPAAWESGVRYFYVEQEPPFPDAPIKSVAKSCAYLKSI